jgi:hypothetical protein
MINIGKLELKFFFLFVRNFNLSFISDPESTLINFKTLLKNPLLYYKYRAFFDFNQYNPTPTHQFLAKFFLSFQ